MAVFFDLLSGDIILSDHFLIKEIEGGMLLEVEGKWVLREENSDCDIAKGIYPKYREIDKEEGIDELFSKVDVVDTFSLKKLPDYDEFTAIDKINLYITRLVPLLEVKKRDEFSKGIRCAARFLFSRINRLRFFTGSSMKESLIFAYYKDGAKCPTFLYLSHGLSLDGVVKAPRKKVTMSLFKEPSLCHSRLRAIYLDRLTGDNVLSDSFPYKYTADGMLLEVQGKWIVHGAGGTDKLVVPGRKRKRVTTDQGVDVQTDKMNDILETCSLKLVEKDGGWQWVVSDDNNNMLLNHGRKRKFVDQGVDVQADKVIDIVDTFGLKELPTLGDSLLHYLEVYSSHLIPMLSSENQLEFRRGIAGATGFLISKLKDLHFFVGGSMRGSLIFSYYQDGSTDPTFFYFAHGLKVTWLNQGPELSSPK